MDYSFRNLKVYKLAYDLAMDIFEISKGFPKEEKYSLTDQIRRSSRSVCSNIAEAYRKRRYPKHFTSKSSDADGEASETMVWIDFAFSCKYIDEEIKDKLLRKYEEVGKMLGSMTNNRECSLNCVSFINSIFKVNKKLVNNNGPVSYAVFPSFLEV